MTDISIHLDAQQEKAIAEYARSRNLTSSELLKEIMHESVEQYIAHAKLIQQGMDDVNGGKLVDHKDVQKGIDKILKRHEN